MADPKHSPHLNADKCTLQKKIMSIITNHAIHRYLFLYRFVLFIFDSLFELFEIKGILNFNVYNIFNNC